MDDHRNPRCPTGLWIAGQFQKWAIGIAELCQSRGIFRFPKSLRPANHKWLVLTIDDAPSSRTTELLAVLDRHSVRCTFFVHTDQITSAVREEAMHNLVEQGHEVANHMPANVAYGSRFTAAQFRADFQRSHERLSQYGDAFCPWFRPPMGIYHRKRMSATLNELGYAPPLGSLGSKRDHIMASFAPWDSTGATNTKDADHNRVVATRYANQLVASLYSGCIVVFHDGEEDNNQARVAATLVSLEQFLSRAKAGGWSICSIGDVLGQRNVA